jgi:myo-inositol-1-phosphate synthase
MAPHANDTVAVVGAANGSGTERAPLFTVNSPNVTYTEDAIKTQYAYNTTEVTRTADNKLVATPKSENYHFKVDRKVGKVGMMLVGWGGNNGTTVTAGIIANRRGLVWNTREGKQEANYYGSVIMGSTIKLGTDKSGREINIPFHDMLPMLHPNDLAIGGWDISGMGLAEAMDRACVLEPALKGLVRKEMAEMKPLPSIYYPDFIAANQEERADNVIPGSKATWDHVEHIRNDIRSVMSFLCPRSQQSRLTFLGQ